MNKQQPPAFERGTAFIFKYQVFTSESEIKVRLLSPFPTLPDVNIDGVHAIVFESNQKLSRMQYRVEQAGCNNITFNESHIPITQQMDNMYKCLKQEVNEAQLELNTLSDVAESFFPPESSPGTTRQRRSMDEDEPHNRAIRLIGAVAALAAGTGFILGEHFKDAACNALSIVNLCDSSEDLERELHRVTKQQKTQQQAFQTVQDQNNEKLALLRDEIHLIQKCYQFKSDYRHFLQSSQIYLSQNGTQCAHFKTFRAAFYAYRKKLFLNHFISCHGTYYTTFLTSNTPCYNRAGFGC